MRVVDTDVLVVGAGVTGLTSALSLAEHGVRALTIARHPGTAPQPRAHITNQRTMEVFRDLGVEDRVVDIGHPLRTLGHNVIAVSLAGREIARYRSYGTGDRAADYAAASPCTSFNAPQHVLEPVLLEAARQRGADIRFLQELVEIEQSADAVLARVVDRESGQEYQVRARYAIGADGARSRVAERSGFDFEGQAALKHMVNVWFAADLTPYTAYRPGVVYMIIQPDGDSAVGSGTFFCVRPWDEWVMVREYDPAEGDPDTSDAAVADVVRTLVGDPELAVRVKGTSRWQVNHIVATEYRRGRVFLAGDAAHRHPPSGGLGSNTSIQDAWNLAWKLAFVLSGRAGDELLDSYGQERQPVGRQIVDRAIKSLMNQGRPMADALGLRRGQTVEEEWTALGGLIADTPEAQERRGKLAEAVRLQHYRSNANGVEMGHRYTSRAVVDDGSPFPPYTRDPALYYHPTTHPGGYLPHAWVEHERSQVSTIDLAGHGQFCLLVGIGGKPWQQAAAAVSAELGVELPVFEVGYRCAYDDVLADWAALREIGDRGALLVRPDRVIAWRAAGRSETPVKDLRAALRHILALGNRPQATDHLRIRTDAVGATEGL